MYYYYYYLRAMMAVGGKGKDWAWEKADPGDVRLRAEPFGAGPRKCELVKVSGR
jgi:hypothetical protein